METIKTVQDWLEEIEAAIEYREKMAYEKTWSALEDCYYNDPSSYAAVGPNLVFSEGDTIISGLTLTDPQILLEAEERSSVEALPVVERLANKLIQPERLNLKYHVEMGALNSYLNSKLILKLGYDSEFGWEPKYDLGTLSQPMGMTATQFDKTGNRIEYMNSIPGMPWVRSVHPHDFVVPWGTGDDIEDAPWVAHRLIRENVYFKKDPKYINTGNLEPQLSMLDYQKAYTFGTKNYRQASGTISGRYSRSTASSLLFNEVWEIHDRMNQQILAVCFTHKKFLRKAPNSLMKAIGGHCFVTGGFVRSSRHFWTPPLSFYLMSHQKDVFDCYEQMTKQRRINVAKFLMLEGAMEQNEVDKLLTGDVAAIAKVKKSAGKRLADVFMPFPKTANYDLMNETEVIRRNTRDVIGFSRNQMGEFDASSRRTAYEAHRVFEGSSNRAQSKEDVIKHAYITTVRKSLKMLSRLWTTPRSIAIGKEWVLFTGAQLSGNFSFRAYLQQHSNMTKAQRTMHAIQMLMYFAQFPNVNLERMEQYVLEAANDPSFEGFFKGLPESTASRGLSPSVQASASNGSEQRPALGAGLSNNTTGV